MHATRLECCCYSSRKAVTGADRTVERRGVFVLTSCREKGYYAIDSAVMPSPTIFELHDAMHAIEVYTVIVDKAGRQYPVLAQGQGEVGVSVAVGVLLVWSRVCNNSSIVTPPIYL